MMSMETAISSLPAVIKSAFETEQVFDERGRPIPLGSNILLEEAAELYRIVALLRPSLSAEVGFAQGISTLAILKALQDQNIGLHHVIDPFQARFHNAGLAMVKRAGLADRMRFHRKYADEVIPQLPELEFGFIDSSHLFDLTIHEFVMMDRKLKVGGILAFHDMWMPSLQKFLRYVITNRSYEVVQTIEPHHGRGSTPRQKAKSLVLSALHHLPGKNRILSQEILRPWSGFRVSNLVLLRKTCSDDREWTFHKPF